MKGDRFIPILADMKKISDTVTFVCRDDEDDMMKKKIIR